MTINNINIRPAGSSPIGPTPGDGNSTQVDNLRIRNASHPGQTAVVNLNRVDNEELSKTDPGTLFPPNNDGTPNPAYNKSQNCWIVTVRIKLPDGNYQNVTRKVFPTNPDTPPSEVQGQQGKMALASFVSLLTKLHKQFDTADELNKWLDNPSGAPGGAPTIFFGSNDGKNFFACQPARPDQAPEETFMNREHTDLFNDWTKNVQWGHELSDMDIEFEKDENGRPVSGIAIKTLSHHNNSLWNAVLVKAGHKSRQVTTYDYISKIAQLIGDGVIEDEVAKHGLERDQTIAGNQSEVELVEEQQKKKSEDETGAPSGPDSSPPSSPVDSPSVSEDDSDPDLDPARKKRVREEEEKKEEEEGPAVNIYHAARTVTSSPELHQSEQESATPVVRTGGKHQAEDKAVEEAADEAVHTQIARTQSNLLVHTGSPHSSLGVQDWLAALPPPHRDN